MNSRPPRDARCGSCGSDPGFHLSSPTEPVPALAPPFGGAAQAMGECSLCLMPYSDTIVLRCGHRYRQAAVRAPLGLTGPRAAARAATARTAI